MTNSTALLRVAAIAVSAFALGFAASLPFWHRASPSQRPAGHVVVSRKPPALVLVIPCREPARARFGYLLGFHTVSSIYFGVGRNSVASATLGEVLAGQSKRVCKAAR